VSRKLLQRVEETRSKEYAAKSARDGDLRAALGTPERSPDNARNISSEPVDFESLLMGSKPTCVPKNNFPPASPDPVSAMFATTKPDPVSAMFAIPAAPKSDNISAMFATPSRPAPKTDNISAMFATPSRPAPKTDNFSAMFATPSSPSKPGSLLDMPGDIFASQPSVPQPGWSGDPFASLGANTMTNSARPMMPLGPMGTNGPGVGQQYPNMPQQHHPGFLGAMQPQNPIGTNPGINSQQQRDSQIDPFASLR